MKKGQGQTISTFANHRIFRLSFCPFPMFSRCVLVLSFVLVCSVLVCSRLAFFPLSSFFPSVILPRGGGWSRFCSGVFPFCFPGRGMGCGTVLSCSRPFWCPSLPPLPFLFIRSPGWFCSVLCPSFRLSFFPFLSFSLSFPFFSYLFLSSRGGWLVTVLLLLCRRLSLFPLSFVFSSFVLPRGGVVMFCFVPPFPYFLLYLFFPLSFFPRSFLPCAGVWLVTFLVCAAPLFLYCPFVPPFFLPPLWLAQIRKSNSR